MHKIPLFAALLFAATAAVADQHILVDSHVPADFAPTSETPMTDTGFWAAGTTDGLAALVRYDSGGTPTLVRFPLSSNAHGFVIASMPDGGAVATDIEDSDQLGNVACKLRRFDAYGNLLWTRSGSPPFYGMGQTCANVRVDGSGGIWLFSPGLPLLIVNADGSDGPQAGVGADFAAQAVAATGTAAVFVAGWSGDANEPPGTLAAVWKVDAQGVTWTSSAPAADAGSTLGDIVLGDDGTLWAFGNKGAQLYGMHVAADGQRLWSGAFDTAVTPTFVRLAARPGGGVFALHGDASQFESHVPGSAPELSAFAATGDRQWHASSGFGLSASANSTRFALAASGDGDAVAAMTYHDATLTPADYLEQLRTDSSGSVQYLTAAQPRMSSSDIELRALPDDTSLSVAGAFERRARNGSVLPGPIADAITDAASLDEADVIAADGSVFLLVANPGAKRFGVLAYSSAGLPLWHTAIASDWDHGGLVGASLVLRSGDVCVAGSLDANEIVQCFARDDGTPKTQVVLAAGIGEVKARTQAVATAGDELVVLYAASDGMHHALLDAQNAVLHDVTPLVGAETWGTSASNGSGRSVVAAGAQAIVGIDADGSRGYAVATDLHVDAVAVAPDGSAMLVDNSALALERVDANGQKLWQSALSPGGVMRSPKFTATDFYFTRVINFFYYGFFGAPADAPTSRYALADGTRVWEGTVPYLLGYSPRLALDSANGTMITFSTWGDRTLVRKLALEDGAVLGSKFVPCYVDECAVFHGIAATDGTLRMVHDTTDFDTGSAFEITIMQNEFDKVFANGFDQ